MSSIEHHCKYDNPELHKSEIMQLQENNQQSVQEEDEKKPTKHDSTIVTEEGRTDLAAA